MAIHNFPTAIKFWADQAVRSLLGKLNTNQIPNDKIIDAQVVASERLQAIAEYYLDCYLGNTGANSFLDSLLTYRKRGFKLTISQLRGVLNCCIAEYKRYAAEIEPAVYLYCAGIEAAPQAIPPVATLEPAAPPAPSIITPAVRDGIYTVVLNESGDYRTLKVNAVPEDKRSRDLPEGVQYIGYLSGPNNDSDYTPCGYLFGNVARLSSRYKADSQLAAAIKILVNADQTKQGDYGHAYALASGKCWRCGRTLTVRASINRGLGPICADLY